MAAKQSDNEKRKEFLFFVFRKKKNNLTTTHSFVNHVAFFGRFNRCICGNAVACTAETISFRFISFYFFSLKTKASAFVTTIYTIIFNCTLSLHCTRLNSTRFTLVVYIFKGKEKTSRNRIELHCKLQCICSFLRWIFECLGIQENIHFVLVCVSSTCREKKLLASFVCSQCSSFAFVGREFPCGQ